MSNNIIKEGYLQKETHSYGDYHHPFEKRWIVLQQNSLVCHRTSKKNDIAHIIDTNTIIDVIIANNVKVYKFEVIRKGSIDNITFIADDKLQMNEWVHSIKSISKLIKPTLSKQQSRQKRSSTAPTEQEENKQLKKENKALQKTVTKLKRKISKLKTELERFKKLLQNRVGNDKYNILITEEEQQKQQKHKKNKKERVSNNTDNCKNSERIDRQHNIHSISKHVRRRNSRKSSKYKRNYELLQSPPNSLQSSPTLISSPASSDNEFESDPLSLGGDAMEVNNSWIGNVFDIFNRLKSINEGKLVKMLMNEIILFDSKMKVFSTSNNTYIDTAGILTKNNLYLISAINYQIWTEFKTRTRIDDIIPDEKDNDLKIDTKTSNELVQNLDIIDDYKINEAIKQHFVGKTKKEIKLNILLNETPIKSLGNLFIELHEICNNEYAQFQHLKNVKCIIINDFYNTDIIATFDRDKFLEHIFDGIPWIEQQKMNDSIVITLRHYYSKSIISKFNNRKNAYFGLKIYGHDVKYNGVIIEEYDNKIRYTQYETTVADIKNFNMLHVISNMNQNDIGFGLILKHKDENNINNHDIQCLFNSNNLCQEWLTHLDYAMLDKSKLDNDYTSSNDSETDSCKNKLINDFTDDDAHFGFGEYLNYWQETFENSVIPNYSTLKQELLNNKISKISENDYYWLYEQCQTLLKIKRHNYKAKEIGVNNKKFNIEKGTPITINHLISLKLYTDFSETQKKFKKTMRKRDRRESLQSLIKRNCECAHWSKYIKEACTFYGNLMGKNITLYTGLKEKLLFGSMRQHFECPLSTTQNYNKAQGFCKDNGCVLKLKAGNSKTRYFDVSWLSKYREERERLIMGGCLKICDIYIQSESAKEYISALLMFEQLINAQFIDTNQQKEHILYVLIAHVMNISNDKNIAKHNIDLFQNMIKEMIQKYAKNELWINRNEISNIKHRKLQQLFNGAFLDYFKIEKTKINWVKEYTWNICGDIYDTFKKMAPRKYILSDEYECKLNKLSKSQTIKFYLRCCAKYSEESPKVALFLHVNLAKNIKSIKIEYDLICIKNEKKFYHNLMMPQMLNNDKLYCGLQTFSASKCLNKSNSILWKIGLKIIDVTYY